MAQTNINIRIDEDLKKQFEAFCSDVGMSMSAAFCIFAKKTVREQRIPFEVSADPFYSEENIDQLEKRISDMKAGKNIRERELIEVDEE